MNLHVADCKHIHQRGHDPNKVAYMSQTKLDIHANWVPMKQLASWASELISMYIAGKVKTIITQPKNSESSSEAMDLLNGVSWDDALSTFEDSKRKLMNM